MVCGFMSESFDPRHAFWHASSRHSMAAEPLVYLGVKQMQLIKNYPIRRFLVMRWLGFFGTYTYAATVPRFALCRQFQGQHRLYPHGECHDRADAGKQLHEHGKGSAGRGGHPIGAICLRGQLGSEGRFRVSNHHHEWHIESDIRFAVHCGNDAGCGRCGPPR